MKMLLIGMLVMYLLLCLMATISEICGENEWMIFLLLIPAIAIFKVLKFVWVKVIHYGKECVYIKGKGWCWKKKNEVTSDEM